MTSFFRKLGWLARRRSKEEEFRDELQFHIDEEAEERRAEGFTPEDAQRAGRRDLGNITLVQEDTRATWDGYCSNNSRRTSATRCAQCW